MTYALALETLRVPGCFPAEAHIAAAAYILASGAVGRRDDVRLAKRCLKGDFARRAFRRAAKRAAMRREA